MKEALSFSFIFAVLALGISLSYFAHSPNNTRYLASVEVEAYYLYHYHHKL